MARVILTIELLHKFMQSYSSRILLLCDVGGSNYYHVGDEAMLSARIDWLKEYFPNATLIVYSSDPKFTTRVHNCESLFEPSLPKKKTWLSRLPWKLFLSFYAATQSIKRMLPLPESFFSSNQINKILQSDLLLICGGGNLNSLFKSAICLRSVIAKIAMAAEIPVVITGQTLGPTLTDSDRTLLSSWLPNVHYLGVRDRGNSQRLAQELGVSTEKIHCSVDDAFYLIEQKPNHSAIVNFLKSNEMNPLVGISFHYHWQSPYSKQKYYKLFAEMLDTFIEKTSSCVIAIPHTYSSTSFSDVRVAQEIKKQMRYSSSLLIIEDFLIDRELKYVTGQCEYVFSTRYHGVIFALSNTVPCTGIFQNEYTQVKLEGAYESLSLPKNTFSITDRNREDLMLNSWNDRHQAKHQISEKVSQQWKSKKQNDKVLIKVISSALN